MPRRVATLLAIALTAFVVLGTTAPVWAHGAPSAARLQDAAVSSGELAASIAAHDDGLPTSLSAATSTPPDLPWLVLLAGLVGVAFGRHRRRRALILALVLLLTIFAFDVGLHSVHHGTDPRQIADCAAGAAAAHLSATPVACVVAVEVVLPAVATTTELDQFRFPMFSLRPDQGRAPPA